MRVKTKLLYIAAFFVLVLPMVLAIGSVQADDSNGTVQGKVTGVDPCARIILVDSTVFNMGDLDCIGIDTGNYVRGTYTNTKLGKVLTSIQVLQGGENQ